MGFIRIGAVARLAAIFAALAVMTAGAAAQTREQANAHRLFELLNRSRVEQGLAPLAWSDRLAAAAVEHTKLMIAKGELSHQFLGEEPANVRVGKLGISFISLGENVAYAVDPETAHDGLMHSPPHRANILNKEFNAVGVVVLYKGDQMYLTEEFGKLPVEQDEGSARSTVLAKLNELRRQKGQPDAILLESAAARRAGVCAMARAGKASGSALLSLEKPEQPMAGAGAFLIADVNLLTAKQLGSLAAAPAARVRIDLCRAPGPQGPAPMWWGVITLYR